MKKQNVIDRVIALCLVGIGLTVVCTPVLPAKLQNSSFVRKQAYTLVRYVKMVGLSEESTPLSQEAREELSSLSFGQTSAAPALKKLRRALLTPTAGGRRLIDLIESLTAVFVACDINKTQANKDGQSNLVDQIGALLKLQRQVATLNCHSQKKDIPEKYGLFAEYLWILDRLPYTGVQGNTIRAAVLDMLDERETLTYTKDDLAKLDDFLKALLAASHADPTDKSEIMRPLVPLMFLAVQWKLDAETFRLSGYTDEAEVIEKIGELMK